MKTILETYGQLQVISIEEGQKPKQEQPISSIEDISKLPQTTNYYWVTGNTKSGTNGKPKKTDMEGSRVTWVDIDLGYSEDFNTKREELNNYIQDCWTDIIPKPTVCIDSGGGFQCFWVMKELCSSDETEAMNKWLAAQLTNINRKLFNADGACFNVDRIMRLPGTLNIPSLKKINEKGYPAGGTMSKTLWDTGQLFDKDELGTLQPEDIVASVSVDTNIKHQSSEEVNMKYKLAVLQPHWRRYVDDYTKPTASEYIGKTGDTSNSVYFFACCMALLRAGLDVSEVVFLSIDDTYGWSKYILEKSNSVDAAITRALRDVNKANFYVDDVRGDIDLNSEDGKLREFNNKYACLYDDSGNFNIIVEEFDNVLTKSKVATWKLYVANENVLIEGKKDSVPVSSLWLKWDGRRTYTGLGFNTSDPKKYDLWQGYDPEPNSICDPVVEEALDEVFENIINDGEQRKFFLDHMAYNIQNPGKVSGRMPLLFGRKGSGKSFIGFMIYYMYGKYATKARVSNVLNQFNGLVNNKLLIFFDELAYVDNEKGGVLKDLLTAPEIVSERKGEDATTTNNYANCIATVDDERYLYSERDERRTYIVECSDHYNFYTKEKRDKLEVIKGKLGIKDERRGDWTKLPDIMAYFKNRDISKFDRREIIASSLAMDNAAKRLPTFHKFWYDILFNNELHSKLHNAQQVQGLKDDVLTADVMQECVQTMYGHLISISAIATFMDKTLEMTQRPSGGVKTRWVLPDNLQDLVPQWNKNTGVIITIEDEDYERGY